MRRGAAAPTVMPTRARRLALPATAVALTLLAWTGMAGAPEDRELRPWSVQLHVHGSFSEGIGSMDSHSFEAQDLGVDAIWWSDHDFRIATYQHVSTYGFEADREPLDRNEPWTRRHRRESTREKWMRPAADRSSARGDASFTIQPVVEGERAMRVRSASRTPRFKAFVQELTAHRALTRRCLATGIQFELAVFPEQASEDARAIVEVVLSEHAPHGDIPFTNHVLHYFLSNEVTEPVLEGNVWAIPVAYEPGRWNRLELDVTADAAAGFPFADGRDNTLGRILFGVETRSGGQATVVFDDFRIIQEVEGPEAYALQREVMAGMREKYPDLAQVQGLEISYETYHLNEFSLDTPLPDYDQLVEDSGMLDENGMITAGRGKDYKAYVTDRLVREAHERGGLISYNHMFGAGREGDEDDEPRMTREETLELLLSHRLFGADILEVGYKTRGGHSLENHLWVWDQLALEGLWPVGDGVSDYHGGLGRNGWRTGLNNFVSWIWAPSLAKPDLLEGLRAGRVYFGDPVIFDGELDVVSDRGFHMGRIVISDRNTARVRLRVTGLDDDDVVKTIVSGVEVESRAAADGGREATAELELTDAPAFARFEVWTSKGEPKVFSNPIVFVRGPLEQGLEPARAGLDLGGLRSMRVERFALTDSRRTHAGTVVLTGSGTDGTLLIDATEFGEARVAFEELTGEYGQRDGLLMIGGVTGSGRIVIARQE